MDRLDRIQRYPECVNPPPYTQAQRDAMVPYMRGDWHARRTFSGIAIISHFGAWTGYQKSFRDIVAIGRDGTIANLGGQHQ